MDAQNGLKKHSDIVQTGSLDDQSGDNSHSDGIFMVMQTTETETKTNKILFIINVNLQ
jgi:hypothetical protein